MNKIHIPLKEDLERMYLKEWMSTRAIGTFYGVSKFKISCWFKEYNIQLRTTSEARLKGTVKPIKEVLIKMYFEEKMNANDIGEKLGVSGRQIGLWLKEYGIQTRTISEAKLKGSVKPTKENLEKMYLDDGMNTYEIAKVIGVANVTVSRWLKEYEIPMRTLSEAMLKDVVRPSKSELERMYSDEWMSAYKIGDIVGVSNVTVLIWLKEYGIPMRNNSEMHFKNRAIKPSEKELRKMYLEEEMSTYEIAEKIGVADVTVGVWLKSYGIIMRTTSESMLIKDLTGEKSHAWRGGLSFLPYCEKFNTKLKDKIRNRDNCICQNCGVKENGEKHNIHHVNYDKENCYPNLITVCRSCNSIANSNRDKWEIFYMNKLNDRGLLHWTLNNGC